jgi:hypothetical protein
MIIVKGLSCLIDVYHFLISNRGASKHLSQILSNITCYEQNIFLSMFFLQRITQVQNS